MGQTHGEGRGAGPGPRPGHTDLRPLGTWRRPTESLTSSAAQRQAQTWRGQEPAQQGERGSKPGLEHPGTAAASLLGQPPESLENRKFLPRAPPRIGTGGSKTSSCSPGCPSSKKQGTPAAACAGLQSEKRGDSGLSSLPPPAQSLPNNLPLVLEAGKTLYKCEAVDQSRSDLGTSQPPPPSGFPLGAECGLLMPNAPHASLSSSPVTNCPHSPPPSATQLRAPLLACASAHPGPLPSPAEWPTALHHSGHLTVILLGYFSGVFNAPPRELSQACRRCVMIL